MRLHGLFETRREVEKDISLLKSWLKEDHAEDIKLEMRSQLVEIGNMKKFLTNKIRAEYALMAN